jgi:ABC-type multidrug transport system fused ATPase/permease subunit
VKKFLKNTWAILTQKEKRQFSILMILDIIISVADILFIIALLWIIQFYIQPEEKTSRISLPSWLADKNSISLIAIFFFLFGVKNIAAFFITRMQNKFTGELAVRISNHNLAYYQHAEFAEFIHTDSSVQIRKIGFQPFEFCQYIVSGIQQVVTQVFLITLSLLAIVLFNARLFIMLLLMLLPPVVVLFYFVKKKMSVAKLHIQSNNERSFQYLLDALKGYVEGNIYNKNHFFAQRFIDYRRKFATALFNLLSLQTMPGRIIEIFAVLGLLILIAIAKWNEQTDASTFLTIGAFIAAAYKIIPGIVKVINTTGQMKTFESSVTDLTQNILNQSAVSDMPQKPAIHSIEFKNIYFEYENLQVIENFSLKAERSDLVGITGKSGKGKTTLFNLLLGFLEPKSGAIIVNEKKENKKELKKYWRSIAYVRQQPFLIHDTILRNIILDEELYDTNNLEKAIQISGVKEMVQNFPEGLNKIITENGKNISGGQQQRITIARAIYKNADLILLDEPFNELDEHSETLLLNHFRNLAKNGTIIIMVTHNQQSLSWCNKVISLDE